MQKQLLGSAKKNKNNNPVFTFPTYQNKFRSEMKHKEIITNILIFLVL